MKIDFTERHPVLFRLLLLGTAAIGLSFAFAPFPLRFLSPICLVPLLWLIETEKPIRVFRYALFFGTFFFALHFWWFYTLVVPVEPVTRILLDVGVTLLFVYLGLYVAVFALLTKRLGLFWSPFIWAALEFIRSQTDIGFPWGLLGASLTPYTVLIQGASLVGVFGLSAWLVWMNLMFYKSVHGPRRRLSVPLLAVSFLVPLSYGLARIHPNQAWFRVGIAQPNVSPLDKGDLAHRNKGWADLMNLSRDATARGAQLLVYPETASLIDLERPSEFRDSLQRFSDSTRVPIISGTPVWHPTAYFNCTGLIEPDKPVTEFYAKMHLAPFSEHFPFVDKVPFLRRIMTRDMGDAGSGLEYKVFTAEIAGNRVRLSTPICFEGIFGDLTRRFAARGAELIVNVTNDGWFGKTPGPYQHCELMLMRAVENGLPFVRSANNGISLVADPYGRTLAKTGLFVMTDLVSDVPRPLPPTLYRRYGEQFAYASLVIVILLSLVRLVAALRNRARKTIK